MKVGAVAGRMANNNNIRSGPRPTTNAQPPALFWFHFVRCVERKGKARRDRGGVGGRASEDDDVGRGEGR